MDTEKCKLLLNIIKTGSFSATAEEMDYTPSGVSRAIDALEKQAGFPILVRSHKGISLTREGEALLPVIKKLAFWSDRYDQIKDSLCGLNTGTVVVGTAYGYYYQWLSRVVAEFHKLYPKIKIEIIEGTSSSLSDMMDERALDFGMISNREGKHRWYHLVEDEFVVMMPENHPAAGKDRVSIDEIKSDPFIEIYPGRETDNSRLFRHLEIHPQIRFSTTDARGAYAMIREGLGICVTNSLLVQEMKQGVVHVPLNPPRIIEMGIIIPEEDNISPAAGMFAEFALARVSNIQL